LHDDFVAVKTISITRGNLEWEILEKVSDKDALLVTY